MKLSTYLWTELQEPLELDETTLPVAMDSVSFGVVPLLSEMDIDSLAENHPYLTMNGLKIKTLEIDQKLKREQVKPTVNLSYNFINEPINYNPMTNLSPNNNKIGVQFEMPLLFRKWVGTSQPDVVRLLMQLTISGQGKELTFGLSGFFQRFFLCD